MTAFPGFKPLSANFTQCPNQFFDRVVGHYQSCVVTVVAILIRSTLGWEDPDTGERRVEAELSLSAFVRPELSETSARKGIAGAIEAGFIVQTAKPTNKQAARYALRWDDAEQQSRAIEKQRKTHGPLVRRGVKTAPHKWEGKAKETTKSRGVDSRPLDSRPLESRPLESTPPIYKGVLKKSSSEKKEKEENKAPAAAPEVFAPLVSEEEKEPTARPWADLPEPERSPWLDKAEAELKENFGGAAWAKTKEKARASIRGQRAANLYLEASDSQPEPKAV